MLITPEEKAMIDNFFEGNQILAECFLQLFEYQKNTVNDIKMEFRDGLIGFKREGERLRLYITKDKNGVFKIKIKAATTHVFMPAEMINYQTDLDKNNLLFLHNKQLVTTLTKKGEKAVRKTEKVVVKTNDSTTIKRAANKRGIQRYMIKNLSVNDIQPIIDCINEFKRDGIKRIRVRITEED